MAADPSLLRLLIATDNHLGVHEDDPIRKDDSFITFEEILSHAVRTKADALLLGGDIFHENKPSRPTVVRTLELLRKYCMNDNPVHIQVMSDQAANFSRCARCSRRAAPRPHPSAPAQQHARQLRGRELQHRPARVHHPRRARRGEGGARSERALTPLAQATTTSLRARTTCPPWTSWPPPTWSTTTASWCVREGAGQGRCAP